MKKIAVLSLLALLTLSLISCSVTNNNNLKTHELKPLNVGILQDTDSIPILIAEEKGYFKEEGLSVNIEKFKSAPERDSALQSKKIDGAISDILAAAFANDGGFRVKITSMTNGTYDLLVNKDTKINNIRELKGKSIAISKNTLIEYVTDMIIDKAGINEQDVHKVAIPQMPARLEMLQNGKVDAATLPNALATVAQNNGAKIIGSSDKLGINPGVMIFSESAISSKKNEIEAFYKAYNKAVDYLNKEPKSSYIDQIIKDGGFPEQIKDTIVLPKYVKATKPAVRDFDSVINWLVDKNLIKNKYKYNDLVDLEFVR